ncbi:P-loop containing NTP hydrolase pore-1-domain-containing protein [Pavlovales sp. CCMP2436]|nr:P-loop containing NTP hydrolase pore-1-domain-containing protein [Pavlovales sp. CCMP2436]
MKVAASVLELQRRLPKARVLYASATGCSEPEHLAYMERLGQWGKDSPFGADFANFLESLEARGVGALELLAMDMKAGGMYLARSLSFKGAEFNVEPTRLSKQQREVYDGVADIASKIPQVVALARKALAEGRCVVIGLQTTGDLHPPSPPPFFSGGGAASYVSPFPYITNPIYLKAPI